MSRIQKLADSVNQYSMMGSKWRDLEAEIIVAQTIQASAYNERVNSEAFSWASKNLGYIDGGGLAHNPKGLASVLGDGTLTIGPYFGEATPPDDVQRDNNGNPLVLKVSDEGLDYVEQHIGGDGNA